MARDYYEVLGVSTEASADDIKKAFRSLAREHHPDATGGDPESERRYKEISEAYAVLSDAGKRREYDAARMGVGSWSSPWGSPFASTIEDIFDTFFGGRAGRVQQQSRVRQGESIEVAIELTLEEVVAGAERKLNFERYETCERCSGEGAEPGTHAERCGDCQGTGQLQQERRTILGSMITSFPCRRCGGAGWVVPSPCTDCRGVGRVPRDAEITVKVPAGVDEGDRMRLSGQGEAGAGGGGRGDLYVRLHVAADERFERVGDDLVAWADVPMTTAALGGSVTIETFDGPEQIEVPAGTQSGEVFRLRGQGIPRRNGRGRGEMIVRARVTTPTHLDDEQEELMRKLAALRGEEASESGGLVSSLRRVLGLDR